MIHVLVVLSFVIVAWVNLIPKPYYLCVAFTVAETIAGLLIYVAFLLMLRQTRGNAVTQGYCQGIEDAKTELLSYRRRAYGD